MSVATGGGQGHLGSYEGTLSADGLFVAWYSQSSNLAPGDTNSARDIFVRDLTSGVTELVSLGSLGNLSADHSWYPAITPGGRYVAFDSPAENLVVGDSNGARDIFLHDRASSFSSFCAGDGSLATPCPCGNEGNDGRGCGNSVEAAGAALVASGEVALDRVRFDVTGVPPDALSMLVQAGASTTNGVVFGDGLSCLASGNPLRLFVERADAADGTAFPGIFGAAAGTSVRSRSAALGDPIAPGSTRWYQVYYRETDASFCPSGSFNVTNGISVDW